MGIKPIPLSAFTTSFVPPVTGIGGSLAPVANTYDTSGHFQYRGRAGSVKRKRTDEIDAVYNLGESYPPLSGPAKPKLDLSVMKDLVVAAGVAGGEVRAILEDPGVDEKMRAFGNLNLALLAVVEAMLESGFVPMSGVASPGAGQKTVPVPPAKPDPVPGAKELREGLEKADRECVLFGANLGTATLANRSALANALSSGMRAAVVAKAEQKSLDSGEMIRDLDDALSCVQDMDFIGGKSQKYIKEGDPKSNTFCTMPVKFRFEDRNARINFEKTLRLNSDLNASISIPKPIREEMKAFKTALQPRYPEEVVAIRLDTLRANLYAVKKRDGERAWSKCGEVLPLPPGILLRDYVPRKTIVLPAAVQLATEASSGSDVTMVAITEG
jgi:hypothetical protein